MHTPSDEQWSVSVDSAEQLILAAEIGRREGFDPSPGAQPRSDVEREWHDWWNNLPVLVYDFHTTMTRSTGPFPPRDVMQQHLSGFRGWENRPLLAELVARYRDDAQQERDRLTEMQMNNSFPPPGIEFESIIESERQRTAVAQPVDLLVNIVHWPETYVANVPDAHLILGIGYADPSRTDELREVLANAVRHQLLTGNDET
jgi:hypothetical protein